MAATESVLPPFILTGTLSVLDVDSLWTFNDGTGSDADLFVGGIHRIVAEINVTPQRHSSYLEYDTISGNKEYNALDVEVGDWVSNAEAGRALRIVEISRNANPVLRVVLEDTGRYNTFQDPSTGGNSFLFDGPAVIFRVDENLVPQLSSLDSGLAPPAVANAYWGVNITQRFEQWRETYGIFREAVAHGYAKGQLLKIAGPSEVTAAVALGTNPAPSVTAGDRARINATSFTWPALSGASAIAGFLNDLRLDNGAITASVVGGAVSLTASDGRDIAVVDLGGTSTTVSAGLGLTGSKGVYEGKLVPLTSDQDDAVAVVTRLGADPDHFYFKWLGRVVDTEVALPGSVGQTLFTSPTGLYTTNPIESGHGVAVKTKTARQTVLMGRKGATTTAGSDMVLNGVYLTIPAPGTAAAAATAINDAGIEGVTASVVDGALRIVQSQGKKIVIWDNITGTPVDDLGLRNFTPGGGSYRLVALDRPPVPKQKVAYPTTLQGTSSTAAVTDNSPLLITVDGTVHTVILQDRNASGSVETIDAVQSINRNDGLRLAEVTASLNPEGFLVLQSLTGSPLAVADGASGSAASVFFGSSPATGQQIAAHGYFLTVRNANGTPIARSTVVKLAASTANGEINVEPLTALSDQPVGIAVRHIASGSTGRIVSQGLVTTLLDTTGAAIGDPVYATSEGDLTLSSNGKRIGIVYEVGPMAEIFVMASGGSGGGGGLTAVIEDTAPALGGDLDVNSRVIFSTEDTDIVLNPRGSGAVVVTSQGEASIQGAEGEHLIISAGVATADEPAGDLILRGGPGSAEQPEDGLVRIEDALGGTVAVFKGKATAVNALEVRSGGTGEAVELVAAAVDSEADTSLLLVVQNAGQILAPPDYDPVQANALVTKDYVDLLTANLDPVPKLADKTVTVTAPKYRLASGTTSNFTVGVPAPGTEVYRLGTAVVSTDPVTGFGDAGAGTLSALVNGTAAGTIPLTSGDNTGINGSLRILADKPYPASTSTHKALDARVDATLPAGLNSVSLTHSLTGIAAPAFVLHDTDGGKPVISAIAVNFGSPFPAVPSSGVPHTAAGDTFGVSATVTKLATSAYRAADLIGITSEPEVFPPVTLSPGQGGIPAILAQTATTTVTTGETLVLTPNRHAQTRIKLLAHNPNGTSEAYGTVWWNVMSGDLDLTPDAETGLQETRVYCDAALGSVPGGAAVEAGRLSLGDGDTPNDDLSLVLSPGWNSSATPALHEAAVVGGVARRDRTDYRTGYAPAGPDYSGKSSVQYISFLFRRSAVSRFRIVLAEGSRVSGCRVKLVGIDTTQSAEGWLDMFLNYRGVGVPGDDPAKGGNGSNGCAFGSPMTGDAGIYTCTFGQQSSSNATNNAIVVRFRLEAGDQITGLSFLAL